MVGEKDPACQSQFAEGEMAAQVQMGGKRAAGSAPLKPPAALGVSLP
jgi:hypothetical protein